MLVFFSLGQIYWTAVLMWFLTNNCFSYRLPDYTQGARPRRFHDHVPEHKVTESCERKNSSLSTLAIYHTIFIFECILLLTFSVVTLIAKILYPFMGFAKPLPKEEVDALVQKWKTEIWPSVTKMIGYSGGPFVGGSVPNIGELACFGYLNGTNSFSVTTPIDN